MARENGLTKRVAILCTPETYAALEMLAQFQGMPTAVLGRQILNEYVNARQEQVAAAKSAYLAAKSAYEESLAQSGLTQ